jgi:hypothetical protein
LTNRGWQSLWSKFTLKIQFEVQFILVEVIETLLVQKDLREERTACFTLAKDIQEFIMNQYIKYFMFSKCLEFVRLFAIDCI